MANRETGNRYTFRVKKHEEKDLWFVAVLAGPDNEQDYTYIEAIFGDQFRRTRASKVGEEAPSFRVFAWLMRLLAEGRDLPAPVRFYHEGRCGRCGKRLTVPESVRTGYGPQCSASMHGGSPGSRAIGGFSDTGIGSGDRSGIAGRPRQPTSGRSRRSES